MSKVRCAICGRPVDGKDKQRWLRRGSKLVPCHAEHPGVEREWREQNPSEALREDRAENSRKKRKKKPKRRKSPSEYPAEEE